MLFHKDMRGVRNSISAADMCKRYIIYYILRAGCGAVARNDYSAIIANEVDMTYILSPYTDNDLRDTQN